MSFCDGLRYYIATIILATIIAFFTLPFAVPSLIYSVDLKDYIDCNKDELHGFNITYNMGFSFAVITFAVVGICFVIAIFSIIPCVGLLEILPVLVGSLGTVTFLVCGILSLVLGLSDSVSDLTPETITCIEEKYECTMANNGCKAKFWDPAKKDVKIIGSMQIIGALFIVVYCSILGTSFQVTKKCCDIEDEKN